MRSLDDLTPDRLERLAGGLIFGRGRQYVADGRVGPIQAVDGAAGTRAISAEIRGSRPYRARLIVGRDGTLETRCSCPMGEDAEACKHVVALGLAWLDERPKPPDNVTSKTSDESAHSIADEFEPPGVPEIRAYLRAQPLEALVRLVLELADRDSRFMERLLVDARTAKLAGAGDDDKATAVVKAAIDRATRIRTFVHYRDVPAVVERARDAIELICRFERAGRHDQEIALLEHALRKVERMIDRVDDSDGLFGDLLGELQDRHLAACFTARPDAVALAERLFRWELEDEWGVFSGAAETYAEVLGPEGLAEYRRLAEPIWATVEGLGRGDERSDLESKRFRITHAMEALARALGDFDGLIAVMSADLSSPYAYLEIAETCLKAGRLNDAIAWARDGIEAYPEATDPRLHDFLADRYQRLGRSTEAVELVWTAFAAQPWLDRYQALRGQARRAQTWPAWRERAIELLRQRSATDVGGGAPPRAPEPAPVRHRHLVALPSPAQPPAPRSDGSSLVEVLLWEGDVEAAWSAAVEFGCRDGLWQRLAHERVEAHPADALPILQLEVERLLAHARPANYPHAAELVELIGRGFAAAGRPADHVAYLAALRVAHGRKRNFVALLDRLPP